MAMKMDRRAFLKTSAAMAVAVSNDRAAGRLQ